MFKYQSYLLKRLITQESMQDAPQIGVLLSLPKSGKTKILIELIKNRPHSKGTQALPLKDFSVFGSTNQREHSVYSSLTLIVVSPSIYYQWSAMLESENLNITHVRSRNGIRELVDSETICDLSYLFEKISIYRKLSQKRVVLVKSTMYSELARQSGNICWSRVVFDDYTSSSIFISISHSFKKQPSVRKNVPMIRTNFTWFVSNNPSMVASMGIPWMKITDKFMRRITITASASMINQELQLPLLEHTKLIIVQFNPSIKFDEVRRIVLSAQNSTFPSAKELLSITPERTARLAHMFPRAMCILESSESVCEICTVNKPDSIMTCCSNTMCNCCLIEIIKKGSEKCAFCRANIIDTIRTYNAAFSSQNLRSEFSAFFSELQPGYKILLKCDSHSSYADNALEVIKALKIRSTFVHTQNSLFKFITQLEAGNIDVLATNLDLTGVNVKGVTHIIAVNTPIKDACDSVKCIEGNKYVKVIHLWSTISI